MTGCGATSWSGAVSQFVQVSRMQGDVLPAMSDLLASLSRAINAKACALVTMQDEKLVCICASDMNHVPDLQRIDSAVLWAAHRSPAGIYTVMVRGLDASVQPFAIVAELPDARPLADEARNKLQDAAALIDMAFAKQAEVTRSAALSPLTDATFLEKSNGQTLDTAPRDSLGDALHRLTEAQALSVELIDALLGASPDKLDTAIGATLLRMGQFCGSDRTYVIQKTGPDSVSNTYEWCAGGIGSVKDQLQDIPAKVAQLWWRGLETDGHVYIPDVLALPKGSDLCITLQKQGIKSLLAVPLQHDGRVLGFVGYDAVHQKRSFHPGEIHLLKSVANVIATLLMRHRTEAEFDDVRRYKELERQKLRATLSVLPDVLLEFDEDMRVAGYHVNDQMDLPVALDNLLGKRLQECLPAHIGALADRMDQPRVRAAHRLSPCGCVGQKTGRVFAIPPNGPNHHRQNSQGPCFGMRNHVRSVESREIW